MVGEAGGAVRNAVLCLSSPSYVCSWSGASIKAAFAIYTAWALRLSIHSRMGRRIKCIVDPNVVFACSASNNSLSQIAEIPKYIDCPDKLLGRCSVAGCWFNSGVAQLGKLAKKRRYAAQTASEDQWRLFTDRGNLFVVEKAERG